MNHKGTEHKAQTAQSRNEYEILWSDPLPEPELSRGRFACRRRTRGGCAAAEVGGKPVRVLCCFCVFSVFCGSLV